jgi:phosphoglycolate phosphatase
MAESARGDPILFELAVFDLDGTLVATDRFWVSAARAGAHRAGRELGRELELPSAEDWMSLVGTNVRRELPRLFPGLAPAELDLVWKCCREEEERQIQSGGAALLPGAAEVLAALRARGLKLAIASNCDQSYLDHMLEHLGLRRMVDAALCLDSPGVRDKAGMVRELAARFGARAVVVVGDRAGDREAAHENAFPFVHYAGAFAGPADGRGADAVIAHHAELVAVLEGRARAVRAALERADVLSGERAATAILGVTGGPASGKSLWARDAALVLEARGIRCHLLELEAWREDAGGTGADALAGDPLAAFALDGLLEFLRAVRAGRRAELSVPGEPRRSVRWRPGEVVIVEGPWLLDPRLRASLDRVVHVAIDDDLAVRRMLGRAGPALDPDAVLALRRRVLPASTAFLKRFPPPERADVVVSGALVLGDGHAGQVPTGPCQTGP